MVPSTAMTFEHFCAISSEKHVFYFWDKKLKMDDVKIPDESGAPFV
jgi:hypothetical protein